VTCTRTISSAIKSFHDSERTKIIKFTASSRKKIVGKPNEDTFVLIRCVTMMIAY